MTSSSFSGRFLKFLLAGGCAAAVNFISRIVLSRWLAYPEAIALAYCIGMATAFAMNRRYVFLGAANHLHHQIFWFVVVNLVALAQTLVVSLLLANYVLPYFGIVWHAETLAHAFGITIPVFTSYLGHKHLSFSTQVPRSSRRGNGV